MDPEAIRRREAHRTTNGQFGHQPHTPPDMPNATPHWPSVTYEETPWARDPNLPLSRRQQRNQAGPYLAAVTPTIADRPLQLPGAVQAAASEAASELTRFDAELGQYTAPFAAMLLRTESTSSSQIEQLTASAKQITLAQAGFERASINAKTIAANTNAMQHAIAHTHGMPLSEQILETHRILMQDDTWLHATAGKWRTEQVWIGGGSSPHTAVFVPPRHERIPAAIADLEQFAKRTDIAPLEQVAIAHAQFETIHPFPDGNGRTGRALAQAMLRDSGITRHVTAPLSAGILQQQDRYIEALTAYRDGDPAPIVELFTDATFTAVGRGRTLAEDTKALLEHWRQRVTARADSASARGLETLIAHPAFTVTGFAQRLGVTYRAAANAIENYAAAGICTPASNNRRNRYWIATEILTVLDDFAATLLRPKP